MITLRKYQQECSNAVINHMLSGKDGALGVLATGCHEKGHPIMMYNGDVKNVENIVIGDIIMGTDSQPRKVLRLVRGSDKMYKITPTKGESFVVNEGHVLSLAKTGNRKGPDTIDISVADYLLKSKTFKHTYKLRRCGVRFAKADNLPVDPWFIGVLLGDGGMTTNALCLTTMDKEINDLAYHFAKMYNVTVTRQKKDGNKSTSLFFVSDGKRNNLKGMLRHLGMMKKRCEKKFIPQRYKTASEDDRLKLLAGILDADGHLSSGGTFDYVSKSKSLANDVVYVSRSLGLAAYVSVCTKSSQTGFTGTYYRVHISGNIERIPCVLPRKKAKPRRQKKRVTVTGFSVEQAGYGYYYGFTVDKDHLYIDGYFNAHHNCGKAFTICDIISQANRIQQGTRVLQLVHTKELVQQNYNSFLKYAPHIQSGVNSAGLNRREYGRQVTFGSIQTLYNKAKDIGHQNIVLVDECHLIGRNANSMYGQLINDLREINPNLKLAGTTATAFRTRSGWLHKGDDALFSDVVYDYGIGPAINDGYLTPPRTKQGNFQYDLGGVQSSGGEFVNKQLEDAVNIDENTRAAVAETVAYAKEHGLKKWLIFATGTQHSEAITAELRRHGVSAESLTGDNAKGKRRDQVFHAFKSGAIQAMVNINIATTGFDDPEVDFVVLMRPTKSAGLLIQMVGRGSRLIDPMFGNLMDRDLRLEAIAQSSKPFFHVLDFGGNFERNGPIDQPIVRDNRTSGGGEAPIKICEQCQEILATAVRVCPCCGFEFPDIQPKITGKAGTDAILSTQKKPTTKPVTNVEYSHHISRAGKDSMKVTYWSGIAEKQHEYISLKHPEGRNWWAARQKVPQPLPKSVEEMIERAKLFDKPTHIDVMKVGKYPKVVGYHFNKGEENG